MIIALALLFATAGDSPIAQASQFDLRCEGARDDPRALTGGHYPFKWEASVDLDKKLVAYRYDDGTTVGPLTLEETPGELAFNGMRVSRATGALSGEDSITGHVMMTSGKCEPAPFIPLPNRKF